MLTPDDYRLLAGLAEDAATASRKDAKVTIRDTTKVVLEHAAQQLDRIQQDCLDLSEDLPVGAVEESFFQGEASPFEEHETLTLPRLHTPTADGWAAAMKRLGDSLGYLPAPFGKSSEEGPKTTLDTPTEDGPTLTFAENITVVEGNGQTTITLERARQEQSQDAPQGSEATPDDVGGGLELTELRMATGPATDAVLTKVHEAFATAAPTTVVLRDTSEKAEEDFYLKVAAEGEDLKRVTDVTLRKLNANGASYEPVKPRLTLPSITVVESGTLMVPAVTKAVPDGTVRDWARRQGIEVSKSGRVSDKVRRQYLAAAGQKPKPKRVTPVDVVDILRLKEDNHLRQAREVKVGSEVYYRLPGGRRQVMVVDAVEVPGVTLSGEPPLPHVDLVPYDKRLRNDPSKCYQWVSFDLKPVTGTWTLDPTGGKA